jgi:hypothetical protein
VNRLPEFAGSVTTSNVSTSVSSGTAGVSNLNLRGLGANRTLVLLDGKRVVGSSLSGTDNNGGAVDINSMPNGLIKCVEVVTGGASAVYGSDALAGVVNFVLDKDFTGIKANARSGSAAHRRLPIQRLLPGTGQCALLRSPRPHAPARRALQVLGERCIHFCLHNQQVHSKGPAYTRHSYRGG